ncbi:MAG: polysaccharide biosynthesis tyrosine autokinase [Chloroflexi bacterium]|nr:polysaccharide biosynthesis tyrosine autokinase [Chloroflexota bacterium]
MTAVFRLLLKWWWLIALSVALGAGVGFFIRTQQPNIYFAKTTILFGQNLGSATTATGGSLTQLTDMITIYSGLVRRPTILEPVIDDLGLGVSVDTLNGIMAVNQVEDLPLLEIVVADTRPDRAADIANRVAQELINQSPTEQISQETEFKREQLRSLQSQIEELQNAYDANIANGANLTSAFAIAQNLQERAGILENLQGLRSLYAEMSAGLADQTNLMRIFEFADPETAPLVTSSIIGVVLAGAAGLLLSVATIVMIAYFDDRLLWQEGMETIQGVRVLGPLGVVPRSKLPLYVVTMPDAIESEVLRQLRAKLVLAAGGDVPKMVTVTSYDSGDGKTITSSNLALVFAHAGLRTLLVDGDIRKGDLHELFRLPNVMGLSDILASREEIGVLASRALLDSGYDHLTILTSGRSNADPAALLSSTRFTRLITRLKTQFDVIVMDSVPTIGGPDSAFMAEISDGVLIIVDSRRTTEKALKRTLQALQQARRANIFGVAFNRVHLQATASHNQPYYRRTLSLSPERLNRELVSASKRRFGLNRHIITDKQGERMYSLKACAIHLGITVETVQNWVKTGYLNTVRVGRRRWVRESEIQLLLERLPRNPVSLDGQDDHLPEVNGLKASPEPSLPALLRDQRDALLDYMRDPQPLEKADDEPDTPAS